MFLKKKGGTNSSQKELGPWNLRDPSRSLGSTTWLCCTLPWSQSFWTLLQPVTTPSNRGTATGPLIFQWYLLGLQRWHDMVYFFSFWGAVTEWYSRLLTRIDTVPVWNGPWKCWEANIYVPIFSLLIPFIPKYCWCSLSSQRTYPKGPQKANQKSKKQVMLKTYIQLFKEKKICSTEKPGSALNRDGSKCFVLWAATKYFARNIY